MIQLYGNNPPIKIRIITDTATTIFNNIPNYNHPQHDKYIHPPVITIIMLIDPASLLQVIFPVEVVLQVVNRSTWDRQPSSYFRYLTWISTICIAGKYISTFTKVDF